MSRISRDLIQYGFTPQTLFRRIAGGNSTGPKIDLNSILKSGSNLVSRCLYLHPSIHRFIRRTLYQSHSKDRVHSAVSSISPGSFQLAHLYFDGALQDCLRRSQCKQVLMIRNVWDIVVSRAHYIGAMFTRHYLAPAYAVCGNIDERIRPTIAGSSGHELGEAITSVPSIEELIEPYLAWHDKSNTKVFMYESLVYGKEKDPQLVRQQLTSLYEWLGINTSAKLVKQISKQLFSRDSKTFQSGGIGNPADYGHEELYAAKLKHLDSKLYAMAGASMPC